MADTTRPTRVSSLADTAPRSAAATSIGSSRPQSTAAAAVSTITQPVAITPSVSPPVALQPLILARDQIFVDARSAGIDDQLAIMHACLKLGETERALHILRALTTQYPHERARFADVHLHNAFIDAYMNRSARPSTRQALYWFDEMKKYGAMPTVSTYAILIKGFLRAGTVNTAHLLLQEMLKAGHSLQALMTNPMIRDEDLKALKLLRDGRSGAEGVEISAVTIKRLMEGIGRNAASTKEEQADSDASEVKKSDNVPEAISTDVLGVRLLKKSLNPVAAKNLDLYERQLQLEDQAMIASLERLRAVAAAQGTEMKLSSSPLRTLMWQWHQKLAPMIREEQERARSITGKTDRLTYGPFITLLDADKISVLTIQQVLRLNATHGTVTGIKTARVLADVGRAIEMEYYAEQLRTRHNSVVNARRINLQTLYSSGRLFDMHVRKMQAKLLEEEPDENWLPRWPSAVRLKLGSLLTSMLISVAKIKSKRVGENVEEEVDAFYHTYLFRGGHRTGVVKFNPKLSELFSRDSISEALDPRMLPMLVLPRPWINFDSGGYMSRKNVCMRIKDSPEQYRYLKEASLQGRIGMVLNGLDVLGSQPWTINRKVFDAALEAWNTGGWWQSISKHSAAA
ncbi:DNA-directed RNA polymerase N-terminal-domain-containing protein [Thamnocephalis sphaerospora]|uniref:DNA-directed RNA polymerase N-terminal-domain-containing protein n=1 Tax=Thamnocephalis sphaerospora TaxID=78915 RepID=A0A4P9XWE1_9FUNG|nr:DNA-directed RNA polymerase N-terminal-domain-containing protein [Thamnocephalis sphaerospora]|eukprot:RKP10634.1 DNA-directed RNA polymerase N-terminal-domain-containing protein [Thamnocephalis sphaerospora]